MFFTSSARALFATAIVCSLTACGPQVQVKSQEEPKRTVSFGVSSIENLKLPSPSVITGKVVALKRTSFTLQDASGKIEVEASESAVKKIKKDEKISVIGVVDPSRSRGAADPVMSSFTAYELQRADRTEIRVLPWRP